MVLNLNHSCRKLKRCFLAIPSFYIACICLTVFVNIKIWRWTKQTSDLLSTEYLLLEASHKEVSIENTQEWQRGALQLLEFFFDIHSQKSSNPA